VMKIIRQENFGVWSGILTEYLKLDFGPRAYYVLFGHSNLQDKSLSKCFWSVLSSASAQP
jgi:hypothetical protein